MKDIFPLEFHITQEIIDEGCANRWNINLCIGALALREAIKPFPELSKYTTGWGTFNGSLNLEEREFDISTTGYLNMMRIKEPITVTFIIT